MDAATLADWVARHGDMVYVLLFGLVLLEIGVAPLFFLPGDPLLFLCGALSVEGGLNIFVLVPLFFTAALGGSLMAFVVGRLLGERAYRHDYRWLDRKALSSAHQFFEGYGAWGLCVTPYVAVLRTFAPLAAGVAQMSLRRFVLAAGCGAALWSVGLVSAGRFLGNTPIARGHMATWMLIGLALGLAGLAWKRLR
ncbi:MAG: VTT domain-containing protein [Paucibacter sp.]|nr:VTT domain-containing protein [Roseateles sp.]MBV8379965.1 VTT domain-containing protein [Roseateles sp.]